MNLGAMLDLGVSGDYLRRELSKLNLDHEFELKIEKGQKHGITGTSVTVVDLNQKIAHAHSEHIHDHGHINNHAHLHDHEHSHDHEHLHDHAHSHDHEHSHDPHVHEEADDHEYAPHIHGRTYGEIQKLIQRSSLSDSVKSLSIKVFDLIAHAEAKIHGKSVEEVHFHEVGAIDSIIDIVGAAICYEALGITQMMTSRVEVGGGFVRCAHGLMPVPAPATMEILKGVPIQNRVERFEMTTPTGAAILKAFTHRFTDEKQWIAKEIGYGLGKHDLDIPNLLRVMIVEPIEQPEEIHADKSSHLEGQTLLETNIDDMSSEWLVYAEEKLLEAGALDVFKTPIIMKKGRPAIKLSILARNRDIEKLQEIVFSQTTSIGMRLIAVDKVKIERKYETISTEFGPISLKRAYYNGRLVNVKPEYEVIKRIADETGLSIKEIYKRIQREL